MVDRNLIREFNVDEAELELVLGESLADLEKEEEEALDGIYNPESLAIDVNQIVEGTILRVEGEEVLIDIGYKSEGIVPLDEWTDEGETAEAGDTVQVLLEEVEDEFGLIMLSKRKADRIREWEKVIAEHDEGDVVTGEVVRKIKGGLLVNIGVNVFLPASQVDIRRPRDINEYMGKDIQCVILKIDESRRNIVVSRRKLIEDRREKMKEALLEEIVEGERRMGVVKNIADFGAFVDLGGIDGLLHITDMSWGRISHPSEVVSIDEELEVVILNVDREKEKIALGIKQKSPSPWENITEKYPVESRVEGEVVNIMSYGAFVKLEDGIEGLVHISEMSWTRRVNHPSELVKIGDIVEVVVLGINEVKQEISLGMKQTLPNPWEKVAEKYPPGSIVDGTVRNLTNYGAFVELEEGIDGLLHVSDMSWTRKISHANEMLKRGDEIRCQILSVDQERKRIALGLKQLEQDPWEQEIPGKYAPGAIVTGKVTKITNFGVFVELETELEGLLHISELSDQKIENPEEVVSVDDEIEVRILRVDTVDRKIGLSRKLTPSPEEEQAAETGGEASGRVAPAMRQELKGGTGGDSGPLFGRAAPAETEGAEESASPTGEAAEAESDENVATATVEDDSTEEASADSDSSEDESTEAEDDEVEKVEGEGEATEASTASAGEGDAERTE